MLGTGTLSDPYQITTRTELSQIPNDYSAHYILVNDIDLTGTNWIPLPVYDKKGFMFTGSLNGNFKRIMNMKIVGALNDSYIGLFKRLGKGGSIKNLGLVGVDISSQGHYTGAFAGNDYQGSFEKNYVTGTIKLTGSYNFLGSFTGQMSESNYSDCYSNVNLIGGTGGNYGGFVGYAQKGSFKRCLALGYYNGIANNWTSSGAFCANLNYGNVTYQSIVEDSHYDSTVNPKGNPAGGVTAKTTAQLKVGTPYNANWSTNTWSFVAGQYPSLIVPLSTLKATKTVSTHVADFLSSHVLEKVASITSVSHVNELDIEWEKLIKSNREASTYMRDIVSGASRSVQVVKVTKEAVTSYIVPIISDVETMIQKFKMGSATVTSSSEGVSSEAQREVTSLRQALTFIDSIVGKSLTPALSVNQIETILKHIENGTLSEYFMNQNAATMLDGVTAENDCQNNSSTNVLENQTLAEVR
ncbi:hypothetical protein M4D70_25445 [Brevibacillus borstelensis]|uniref:hypothetical protein n=1 Tax=Brevibacillus borstelensis TaxID=45462 RepID=UPI00204251C8|nr:hypothetical protein [Brevibacillus borstelensis]MCM3625526.1 hypothetical protein [Brevibacillus borstelensis]